MDQVDIVAVTIGEEDQPVSLILVRFSNELDVLLTKLFVRSVEIIHCDCQVTDTGVAHLLCATGALAGDDLQHGAVGGFYEEIAVVLKINLKFQMIDKPLGKRPRIRRGNRRML